jgi:ribosomal protein S8
MRLKRSNSINTNHHTLEASLTGKALDFGSNEYGFDPRVSNIRYNSYAYVINHLNLAISRKKLRIKIKYTRKTFELTKALSGIGYISNYSVVSDNSFSKTKGPTNTINSWIYINTTFFKNTPFFKSLRLVSTPSKKHTTTIKGLRVINLSIKSSVIILSTPYGIIDHREALRIGTGGTILCIAS